MIQLPFSPLMTFLLQLGNIALHFYGSLDHCGHSVICKIICTMTVQSSNKSANVYIVTRQVKNPTVLTSLDYMSLQ